jgi:hypothetical protein
MTPAGLPDLSRHNIPKYTNLPLNYQMAIKWLCYIPNGHRISQLFPFQCPPKVTQIGIFGLKIYHLATLDPGRNELEPKKTFNPSVSIGNRVIG